MITIFESTSFETLTIRKLLVSNAITVFVSYRCVESSQPSIISSGGNFITVLKVCETDYLRAQRVLRKYYKKNFLLNKKV